MAGEDDDSADRAGAAARGFSPHAIVGGLTAGLVIGLDQFTKWLVLGPGAFSPPGCLETGRFPPCRHIDVSPVFDLTMVWNYGVSFGLLEARDSLGRWLLMGFALAVAAFLATWLAKAERRLTAIGLGFVIGGALGNFIDRARFGAVADFLDFSGLYFPWVFNVADASINSGVALLLLDVVLEGREGRARRAR